MEKSQHKRKEGMCLTRVKRKKRAIVQIEENLLNSVYLTYDVLRIIFQYLSYKDLSKASVVCRLWLEVANYEKQIRGPYSFMNHFNWEAGKKSPIFENIRNLRIKPFLEFYFVTNRINSFKNLIANYDKSINKTTVVLLTEGIVLNENEIEDNTLNVACGFLPKLEVTLHVYLEKRADETYLYPKTIIRDIKRLPVPNNKKSTCLMLFCNDRHHDSAICLAKVIKSKCNNKLTSVWGGMINNQYILHDNKWEMADIITIVISGSIQTWSIVIDIDCNTKEKVEASLRSWRTQIKLKKHNMGFMFACRGRGQSLFNEANVESSIFRKIFPEVQLIGCFGNGEFGKNTIFENSLTWFNQYSTVFMILTYG